MKRAFLVSIMLTITVSAFSQSLYLDRSQPDSVRAADLLGRLTLQEKVSLLMYESPAIERLGIKQYTWWNEALHGVARAGEATVFPMPIGMAASFDDDLILSVFTSVSDEARVKNRLAAATGDYSIYKGLTFWTPNINIFRDPRWGRGMETYGEDPYLTGRLGLAVVKGLQGDPDAEVLKAHACAKHFAVHSGPEYNRHSFDAVVSERDLRETYLPAFRKLVVEGKVQEVMFAYNRFRGYPCGASKELLQDILRDEWKYDGLIVSDCWAVDDFYVPGRHGFSASKAEAAAATLLAGCNLECGVALHGLPDAVAQGLVTEADIDKALIKNLTARFRLGEMDAESPYDSIPVETLCSEQHAALSLEAARESMVLLQNNKNVLPLDPATAKIALVGPNAADSTMMWGNYNGFPQHTVTLLEAMKKVFPNLKYVKGCDHVSEMLNGAQKRSLIAELEGYETIVFAGGISPILEGEEMPVEVPGFRGGDRTIIELPEVQRDLFNTFKMVGKKVILVNFSGSAVGFAEESETCDAILQAWYPGQEGGTAVTEVLTGKYNPSGKLPLTFYSSTRQLPDFENYDMKGHTYRYFEKTPRFPFGHGLSYTTFEYGEGRIEDGALVVPVTNAGKVDGSETVQMYVKAQFDSEGPIKTLRGYDKISIPAGKTVEARIPLTDETFEWWSEASRKMQPTAGTYTIFYGGSSDSAKLKTLSFDYSLSE